MDHLLDAVPRGAFDGDSGRTAAVGDAARLDGHQLRIERAGAIDRVECAAVGKVWGMVTA